MKWVCLLTGGRFGLCSHKVVLVNGVSEECVPWIRWGPRGGGLRLLITHIPLSGLRGEAAGLRQVTEEPLTWAGLHFPSPCMVPPWGQADIPRTLACWLAGNVQARPTSRAGPWAEGLR